MQMVGNGAEVELLKRGERLVVDVEQIEGALVKVGEAVMQIMDAVMNPAEVVEHRVMDLLVSDPGGVVQLHHAEGVLMSAAQAGAERVMERRVMADRRTLEQRYPVAVDGVQVTSGIRVDVGDSEAADVVRVDAVHAT